MDEPFNNFYTICLFPFFLDKDFITFIRLNKKALNLYPNYLWKNNYNIRRLYKIIETHEESLINKLFPFFQKKNEIKRIPKITTVSIYCSDSEELYKIPELFDHIQNLKIYFPCLFLQNNLSLKLVNSIPNSVENLEINCITEELSKNFLNKGLKHLLLDFGSSKKINQGVLPENLLSLKLKNKFNTALEKNVLPNSLLTLHLSDSYNQKLELDVLPHSLTNLTFGNNFNQIINPNVLPSKLTTIQFGHNFNQILQPGIFPNSLLNLSFGKCFNQILQPGIFPSSLLNLIFGKCFNSSLENILPKGLETLYLGNDFNQPIYELPLYLQYLCFGTSFNQDIDFISYLSYLEFLQFGTKFNQKIKFNLLSKSLKCVRLVGIDLTLQIQQNTLIIHNNNKNKKFLSLPKKKLI